MTLCSGYVLGIDLKITYVAIEAVDFPPAILETTAWESLGVADVSK